MQNSTAIDRPYVHPILAQAIALSRALAAVMPDGGEELWKAVRLANEIVAALTTEPMLSECFSDGKARTMSGEPVFVLRANDRLAPFAVMTWAKDAELHGAPLAKVHGAQKIAFEMIEWQQKHGCKVPD